MTGDHLDACRDAGALIRATKNRDCEAIGIVLDYCDTRAVAEILARVVVTACHSYGPGFLDDLCAELRDLDHHQENTDDGQH